MNEFSFVVIFELAGLVYGVESDGCVLQLDPEQLATNGKVVWKVLGVGVRGLRLANPTERPS